jgi:hypothetical protein
MSPSRTQMRLDVTRSVEAVMGVNFWFEDIIDAYLQACAENRNWREACAIPPPADKPRRVLTQKGLKQEKGIKYSRQHVSRKVRDGTFPPPFQLTDRFPP